MPRLSHDTQERRRAHILDSAEVCFARTGFHRTTMVDICREAKISAGALYVYFDSKEALIDGIVGRDREEIAGQLAAMGSAPDFFAALEGSLRSCVLERPAHKAALYVEMIAEAHRNPRVAATLGACDSTLKTLLCGLVDTARTAGLVAPGADAAKLATVMMMIGDALFLRRAVNPSFNGEALVPELMQMIRALMLGDGALVPPAGRPGFHTHAMGAAE